MECKIKISLFNALRVVEENSIERPFKSIPKLVN